MGGAIITGGRTTVIGAADITVGAVTNIPGAGITATAGLNMFTESCVSDRPGGDLDTCISVYT